MNWYDKKRRILEAFYKDLSADDKVEWAIHRKACDKSSFFFIKEIGGSMPKSGGDISPVIHKPILDRWQDRTITRQACYMPRSWKKSTCLTQWSSLWEYLQNNEIRILIPTEREEKASEWLSWIESQIVQNQRLRWLYPELSVVSDSYTRKHPWSGKKFLLPRQGVYPEATVSIIGIRGGAQGGHYDIINGDDLVGEKGMESGLVLEDAERWFDNCEGLLIEKDPLLPDASRVRIVGTHWAKGDMGSYIQEEYPEYKWMIVPCLKDETLENTQNIEWIQHPGVGDGESNWPEMFTTEVYSKMKANPQQEMVFWTQYMNNPKPSPINPFDVKWLKKYHYEKRESDVFIVCNDDKEEFRVGSFPFEGYIDPGGFSDKATRKNPSRFGLLLGGQPVGSIKKFVLYTRAFRCTDPDKAKDEVFKANNFFRERFGKPVFPSIWKQEVYGQQNYILKDIRKEAEKRRIPIRIVDLPADENKDSKALTIDATRQPMFSGEIYVHESDAKDLEAEINNYGSPATTKDLFDLLGQINKHSWKRNDIKPALPRPTARQAWQAKRPDSRTGY